MKRNAFIRITIAAATVAALPFKSIARQFMRDKKGFKVDSGLDRTGKALSLMEGDTFFTKLAGADTDNDLFVFESTRVKEGGPSYHVHPDQDEWWYIMSGTFLFRVGGVDYTGKPGDFVFGPRGVPHTFSKTGDGEGKLLMGFQPAGKMEAFFKKSSEGILAKMSEEEREVLRKEHGFYRVGPGIGPMKI